MEFHDMTADEHDDCCSTMKLNLLECQSIRLEGDGLIVMQQTGGQPEMGSAWIRPESCGTGEPCLRLHSSIA